MQKKKHKFWTNQKKAYHPLVLSFEWGSEGSCIVVLGPFDCTRLSLLSAPADLDLFETKEKFVYRAWGVLLHMKKT